MYFFIIRTLVHVYTSLCKICNDNGVSVMKYLSVALSRNFSFCVKYITAGFSSDVNIDGLVQDCSAIYCSLPPNHRYILRNGCQPSYLEVDQYDKYLCIIKITQNITIRNFMLYVRTTVIRLSIRIYTYPILNIVNYVYIDGLVFCQYFAFADTLNMRSYGFLLTTSLFTLFVVTAAFTRPVAPFTDMV